MYGRIFITLGSLLLGQALNAQLSTADFFSSHMVFQRDQPIAVWGRGIPGQTIAASFAGATGTALVKKDSAWKIILPPHKASNMPQSLIISDQSTKIVLNDILIGDVWLCLGQSNMQWPMMREMHYTEEKRTADRPLLRFYNPSYAGEGIFGSAFPDSVLARLDAVSFYKGSWEVCDTQSIAGMSAVGYYFGKAIQQTESVPIGLIDLSVGGAPLEAFIDEETLLRSDLFARKVNGDWLQNASLPGWVRERAYQNTLDSRDAKRDELGVNHGYKPGFLFHAGIKPLLDFAVKGMIWYQGESNSLEWERVEEYNDLLALMVKDYRQRWKNSILPFYWVQLSSIDTADYASKWWPYFRDQQRIFLKRIKKGGMAVSSDAGLPNDVHPRNKRLIGERLARWALNETYRKSIVPSGPLPIRATGKKRKVIVRFRYGKGLMGSGGSAIQGLSVTEGQIKRIVVRKNKLVLKVTQKPGSVLYGWQPYSKGNLINGEGLPASTFKLTIE